METQEHTQDWMNATALTAEMEAESHREAIITSLKAMDSEGTPLEEALTEIKEDLESDNII